MKICSCCKIEKSYDEYHKSKNDKDGYKTACKVCRNKKQDDYRQNNKDKINEYMKNYSEVNSTDIKLKCKKWVNDNRDKANETKRLWKRSNKERLRKYNKTYTHKWRMFLHGTLKRMNLPKSNRTIDMLGYSPLKFKEHLESLFLPGMSWDNHGDWHIDHIKPLSLFASDTPINIVNALDNIQPLWAKDNLIKGDNYTP